MSRNARARAYAPHGLGALTRQAKQGATKMAITAKLNGTKLVIEIDAELENPEKSQSGKTLLVASTHGSFKVPGLMVKGKQVTLNLSAYIKAEG